MRRGAPVRRPVAPPPSSARGGGGEGPLLAWVSLLSVHKRALAAIRDDLEHDTTLPRFDLLANLVRRDGQTLASLSRSMLVTAGNLTGLVARAARDGLVERRADPTDRRAWRVHLTPKGLRTFSDAARPHAARVGKVFSPLSSTELATLVRLLGKVRLGLHDSASSPLPERGSRARSRRGPRRKGR